MSFTGNETNDELHGPVPDDLGGLVSLLNTVDLEEGFDQLADRSGFDAWLGLAGSGTSTQAELTTARHLRTGLRALAARNCGQTVDEADLAAAAGSVKRLPVSIQLASGDSAIVVDGKGATRVLGEVLASYARAVEQGRWSRVKLCASPSCRWAFWDGSKNGSRKWCAMSVCGSRAKMRDYRERSRRAPCRDSDPALACRQKSSLDPVAHA
jgi:predicted RNA-binding Zn ribbon-like protein